jgi:hypothetical protein
VRAFGWYTPFIQSLMQLFMKKQNL